MIGLYFKDEWFLITICVLCNQRFHSSREVHCYIVKMPGNEKISSDGCKNMVKDKHLRIGVDTLLDICSRNVAEFVPFQYIEERYQYRIPGKIRNQIQ